MEAVSPWSLPSIYLQVKSKFRLTRSTDFKRVRRFGRSFAHPLIVLIALPGDHEQTRLGIAAGRSLGNAVHRNRAKRLLREALRPHLPSILPGWQVVLISRQAMSQADFPHIQDALLALLQRAHLLKDTNAS